MVGGFEEKRKQHMSALFDSGLFDSEDMAKAYCNSSHVAKQSLQITVTRILSHLSGIAPYDQASPSSLLLSVRTSVRWCLKCETEVAVMIWITV
jgi:hypothetical protein